MKVTKAQLREMVKESVKRQMMGEGTTMKITVKELNERVRQIVQNKLAEVRSAATIPRAQQISEGLGFGGSTAEAPKPLELTERDQMALRYATQLSKSGGSVDSPKALTESVTSLRAAKAVVHLTDEELETTGTVLREWSAKHDDSIQDAAKTLADRLANC